MSFQVLNASRNVTLAVKADEATTMAARLVGLLRHKSLPAGEGLHIRPCNSIHTFFMRFAIDAVFLDAARRVVRIYGAMPPWRVSTIVIGASSVLELPAGVCSATGTQVGDELTFQPLTNTHNEVLTEQKQVS